MNQDKQRFQDIVPPSQKRSIRNVSSSRRGRGREAEETGGEAPEEPATESARGHSRAPRHPRARLPRSARFGIWFFAFIAVVVLGFAFFLLFSGATVTAYPEHEQVRVDGTFEAAREPRGNAIPFEVMTLSAEASETVAAAERTHVEERASGEIIVYNDHSERDQRLIKNTRFETPEGLVYRIPDSIVVPGQYENEAGEVVPGSVTATVYADEAGEEYNIGRTDFTVPGFKGDPRYERFYARSKTEMTGGFLGERLAVEEPLAEETREKMHGELSEELLRRASAEMPDGFHLFEDAVRISYRTLPQEEAGDGRATLRERGTLEAALFDRGELARLVARNTVPAYEGEPVRLAEASSLTFAPAQAQAGEEPFAPAAAERFSFTLRGDARVIWTFDAERLKQDLAGKSKDALQTVLSGYEAIERAEIVIRPFWRQSFPPEPADIEVRERIEAESGE